MLVFQYRNAAWHYEGTFHLVKQEFETNCRDLPVGPCVFKGAMIKGLSCQKPGPMGGCRAVKRRGFAGSPSPWKSGKTGSVLWVLVIADSLNLDILFVGNAFT